jgi:pimeloyl-ACP methyl ester carboxylesterase
MTARFLRTLLALQFLLACGLSWWFADLASAHLPAWMTVATVFMGVALLHPLFVCSQFLLAWFARSPVPRQHRINPWQATRMLDAEFDAAVRTFVWAQPFRSGRAIPEPVAPLHPVPLLFIHGYFCNRAVWQPMIQAASARGHRCAALNLEPLLGSIDAYASQIEEALSTLLAASGAPQAVLIGHSMGGLAARAWMRAHGDTRVARLITLATPHAGTVLATFAQGENGQQMRHQSSWTTALNASETPQRRALMTCIYSHHDNVVAPQLSASLEGATNIAVGGLGHVSLMYAERIQALVFADIDRVRPLGHTQIP